MSPEDFQRKIAKGNPSPVYLFLGQESYNRRLCRRVLLEKVLREDSKHEGLTQTDLEETSLSEVLDDARSLSLFSQDRVIWVSSAEAALPRRMSSGEDEEGGDEKRDVNTLSSYLKSPSAGTVLVFECSRYDFNGDDRPKLERVQKFYSAVGPSATVEFRLLSPQDVRALAQDLAKKADIKLPGAELATLLESVGGDAERLANEIEKLALFLGPGSVVGADHLRKLVRNTGQSNIFALVSALGQQDRARALHSLDILVRDGEYLPLALTFLSTQFRLALAAKDEKATSVPQALSLFAKLGVRMWRDRAEQILATATAFSRDHLARAVAAIYEADKRFREGYRNDQIIMELLVMALTAR